MGVNDYPTREQVLSWLQDFDGRIEPTKKMRTFIEGKMTEGGFANPVIRNGRSVSDFILDDLPSYAQAL